MPKAAPAWVIWKPLAYASALIFVAGISACAAVDDALFSGSQMEAAPGEAGFPAASDDPQPATATAAAPEGRALEPEAGTAVGRIPIAEGEPTGTAVGQQVQQVRNTLIGLQDRFEANARRLAVLHASQAASAATYNSSTSAISSRLLLGSTRGSSELVVQWNTAQDALDRIAADINALNALGAGISADKASANITLANIRGMSGAPGAAEEDRRQLGQLEDETRQSIAALDRVLANVSQNVQRATSYVANERPHLATLANAIKSGGVYGDVLGSPALAAQPAAPAAAAHGAGASPTSGTPLVVIKFDKPNVEFQQILYTALAQALERRPEAGFQVVAVAPTATSESSMQVAQSQTQRNAQAVLRSMTDMGVPASRLALLSTTDPGVSSSEVRVYMR
ncbi:MAG: hypothetical protein ACT4OG_07230 [Alphaproteobacteria bacterium]